MTIHHINAKERGATHLILVLAFVVGLVGVLGFLGYNAWQKQNADAGGANTVASRSQNPVMKCLSSVTASPSPNYRTSTTYEVKVKAVNGNVSGRLNVGYSPTGKNYFSSFKYGSFVKVERGKTATIRFTAATPRTVDGKATDKVRVWPVAATVSDSCKTKTFSVDPVGA